MELTNKVFFFKNNKRLIQTLFWIDRFFTLNRTKINKRGGDSVSYVLVWGEVSLLDCRFFFSIINRMNIMMPAMPNIANRTKRHTPNRYCEKVCVFKAIVLIREQIGNHLISY